MKKQVIVTTAIELSAALKTEIKKIAQQLVDSSLVEIQYRIDPQLVGGIKMRLGGQSYDASLATSIDQLLEQKI